ncbi:MAG TPA: 4Fe-4S dicluster domain-containing protein [Candidatus Ratteibacteria bacterium]|jgi:hydrogenase-4 component H|uniref:NAD(P)H-quinone oxidoreductase subunit I n=1 Tax=candidate division TA06 bacterium ADurb.Bin131 TaxID=1852827 RepID=A0A1V6C4Y5_UNCT6|nr:MAG: NAD(P)H-quinone oxidoreductase subunit I [candidate division TA06 bacterium ADurb.Bin131]HOC02823.1 4Fe-4S dicluster domain-containing protein [bacterium]HRS05734.1 4Fe-4S dicluster domain-containing protein [Candidatus Ratteibacteria bacterium]HON04804.1 4Fe-4S dicluster domain-containing protein [bacterium]HOQ81723.1 4Fe-4S dicluster domain-containing protein [bacterium]
MRKPKIRELREAIKSMISKPYTTKFPYEEHIPFEKFRGKPVFNPEKCVGCGACSIVCPAGAIQLEDRVDEKNFMGTRKLTHYSGICIFCGQCEANCIADNQGIKLSKEFDLAYFHQGQDSHFVEQELLICRSCGRIIGAKKHLIWAIKKIGHLSFAQGILLNINQELLTVYSGISERKIEKPFRYTDIFKVICPQCRRETLILDEKIKP